MKKKMENRERERIGKTWNYLPIARFARGSHTRWNAGKIQANDVVSMGKSSNLWSIQHGIVLYIQFLQTFKVVNQKAEKKKQTNKTNENGNFSNLNGKYFSCWLSDMNPYKSDENRNANFFLMNSNFALKITSTHIHCTDGYGGWWECDRFYNGSNKRQPNSMRSTVFDKLISSCFPNLRLRCGFAEKTKPFYATIKKTHTHPNI